MTSVVRQGRAENAKMQSALRQQAVDGTDGSNSSE